MYLLRAINKIHRMLNKTLNSKSIDFHFLQPSFRTLFCRLLCYSENNFFLKLNFWLLLSVVDEALYILFSVFFLPSDCHQIFMGIRKGIKLNFSVLFPIIIFVCVLCAFFWLLLAPSRRRQNNTDVEFRTLTAWE